MESMNKHAEIVNKLTGSFTNVAISVSDQAASNGEPANAVILQRLGFVQREWVAKVSTTSG